MSLPKAQAEMIAPRPAQSASPQLMTPYGTPPAALNFPSTFSEARLAQLLSNFDHGTHSFDRAERETQDERRQSFGDAFSSQRPGRRPSFLSGLAMTRPGFGFSSSPSSGASTPLHHTPISASNPKDHVLAALSMTKTNQPETAIDPISRPKSTPAGVQSSQHLPNTLPVEMHRSNTVPNKVTGGFGQSKQEFGHHEEHRHFDPSKEPRLLGLL